MSDDVWGMRESVPSECASWWGTDRGYTIGIRDTVYSYKWGSCESPGLTTSDYDVQASGDKGSFAIEVYPNPAQDILYVNYCSPGQEITIHLPDILGRQLETRLIRGSGGIEVFNPTAYPSNMVVVRSTDACQIDYKKIILSSSLQSAL
jgi:arabinogalactan endo-1,4-beta-galactosidase